MKPESKKQIQVEGEFYHLEDLIAEMVSNRKIIDEQNSKIKEQNELIEKQNQRLDVILNGTVDQIVLVAKYGAYMRLSDITNNDITEIVEQSKKTDRQKKEVEAIFETISDGVTIIDIKGQYKLFNKKSKEFFSPPKGYSGGVFGWLKETEFSYFKGDKIPHEESPASRIIRGDNFSDLKISAKFPNKLVHLNISGTAIYDEEGKFVFGVLCSRDMTDYYKQEELLKSQNDFLNRLIDNFKLPVIGLSCPDLKVLKVNQKALDIIDVLRPDIKPTVEIKGKKVLDIVPSFKNSEYFQIINKVINEKKTKYFNKRTFLLNGEEGYWNFIFEPIFEKNGEMEEMLVLAVDITTEIKSNKIMEKTLKSQEEFLANISHELKTPLNVIYSTIQLFNMYLKEGSLEEKKDSISRYINSLIQNCNRLSKLINNIVDLSKIEAGFFQLNLSNNNIVEIVEGILMSVTDYTDVKGMNIIFDTDTEEKIIACDPEMIERILLNLISNAIKFSERGNEIFVNIENKDAFVEISVKDSGIGIEHNQLDTIFDRFKQIDKSLSRNAEGTGIGLSLVKAIVEMHGGRIYVESEFGKGSKFIIELPIKEIIQGNALFSNRIVDKTENLQVEFSDICL